MTYNPNAFVPAKPTPAVDPLAAKVKTLKEGILTLPGRDRGFATSLVTFYETKAFLSEKQEYWVNQINARVEKIRRTPAAPVLQLDSKFSQVMALFAKAQASGLRYPKIRLETSDGIKVILKVLGPGSKTPGDICVTDNARDYALRRYFGRIDKQGVYHPNPTQTESVYQLIKELAANPAGMAALYGHKTSACCFCGLGLTTRESVAMGYGPICAENYGLPWGEIAPPTYTMMVPS